MSATKHLVVVILALLVGGLPVPAKADPAVDIPRLLDEAMHAYNRGTNPAAVAERFLFRVGEVEGVNVSATMFIVRPEEFARMSPAETAEFMKGFCRDTMAWNNNSIDFQMLYETPPRVGMAPGNLNTTTPAGRVAGELQMRTAFEEAIHVWERSVGQARALAATPRYASYLTRTGSTFHQEAYAAAYLEEMLGLELTESYVGRYAARVAWRQGVRFAEVVEAAAASGAAGRVAAGACEGAARQATGAAARRAIGGARITVLGRVGPWAARMSARLGNIGLQVVLIGLEIDGAQAAEREFVTRIEREYNAALQASRAPGGGTDRLQSVISNPLYLGYICNNWTTHGGAGGRRPEDNFTALSLAILPFVGAELAMNRDYLRRNLEYWRGRPEPMRAHFREEGLFRIARQFWLRANNHPSVTTR